MLGAPPFSGTSCGALSKPFGPPPACGFELLGAPVTLLPDGAIGLELPVVFCPVVGLVDFGDICPCAIAPVDIVSAATATRKVVLRIEV
jgi:hypothetical protein